jgi:hypothetical protein
MSWPQIVVLLFIAGTIVAVPDPGTGRFVLAGSLIAIVAAGVIYKLRSKGRPGNEGMKSP